MPHWAIVALVIVVVLAALVGLTLLTIAGTMDGPVNHDGGLDPENPNEY